MSGFTNTVVDQKNQDMVYTPMGGLPTGSPTINGMVYAILGGSPKLKV